MDKIKIAFKTCMKSIECMSKTNLNMGSKTNLNMGSKTNKINQKGGNISILDKQIDILKKRKFLLRNKIKKLEESLS